MIEIVGTQMMLNHDFNYQVHDLPQSNINYMMFNCACSCNVLISASTSVKDFSTFKTLWECL